MIVLSLFDGISCAKVALGNNCRKYYASEIDPYAVSISKKNHPDIQHLGDVCKITKEMIKEPVDLLIGGSPCVDLSITKKDRKGLDGDKSKLFFEYIRVKNLVTPKYWILENVASMPKKDRDIISQHLGVQPILIDASLVSAQSRRRLFWTNIPNVTIPTDRKIYLKDILLKDDQVPPNLFVTLPFTFLQKEKETNSTLVGHIGNSTHRSNRVYSTEGKSTTLIANAGGLGAKTGLYVYTPSGNSTASIRCGSEIRRRLDENGVRKDDNKDIPLQRRVELRNDDKSGTLTTVIKDNRVFDITNKKIRKLAPIECERLQSLPDDYTKGISDTQRYKCLGNAFNVEVIKHILSFIQK